MYFSWNQIFDICYSSCKACTNKIKVSIVFISNLLYQKGKIVDYSAANNFLHEIMANPSYDWNVLERIYAPIYKDLRAELSSLIPNSEFYHKAETLLTIWKGLQSRKNKDKISPPQFSLPPSIQTLQSFISIPNNMNVNFLLYLFFLIFANNLLRNSFIFYNKMEFKDYINLQMYYF